MLEGVVVTAAGGELHTLGGCLAASKVVGVRWSGEEASCLNRPLAPLPYVAACPRCGCPVEPPAQLYSSWGRLPYYLHSGAACPVIFTLGPPALSYSRRGHLPTHTRAACPVILTLDCLFHYTRTLAACPGTLASRAACPVHSH